ncbi:MAG: DUF2284 domain-containing protein [Oscillospiraceae bacterium]|nr:DUF2284 domain-containing protein [Oscillospiraceae bacterium]
MEDFDFIKHAKDCGFTEVAETDPGKFRFMKEVRDMCRADKCNHYNKSWNCPPACGTLEETAARASRYGNCVLVQTVGHAADEYDVEFYTETAVLHNKNFRAFVSGALKKNIDIFPMGMGACRLCEVCAYPDLPCRFPDTSFLSMEACGLLVSRVCEDAGLPYYYGPGSIAYISCCLYNVKSTDAGAERT